MSSHPPADRLEFWVRFVCGAFLGAVVGASLLTEVSAADGWWVVPVSMLVFGLVAGWFGDPFWRLLGGLSSRW